MRKNSILSVILIIVISFTSGCGNTNSANEIQQENVAIAVKTETITFRPMEQYVNVSSKVYSENEVSVIPKASGTVKNIFVSLGDSVKAGDVLFEIDDTDAKFQVEQAQAAVDSARAALESAQANIQKAQTGVQQAQATLQSAEANYQVNIEGNLKTQIQQMESNVNTYEIQYNDILKNLERTKILYESGIVTQTELENIQSSADKMKLQLDNAKNELELNKNKIQEEMKKLSQATVEQAQAAVEQSYVTVEQSKATASQSQAAISQAGISLQNAQKQLDDTKVKAEIDGVIGNINISKGSTVNVQSQTMTISSQQKMKVSFGVSENVINKITTGSKVYVTISAVSSEPFETEISKLSYTADKQTKLYTIEAYINNDDNRIKSGMFAHIQFVTDKKENVIAVPLNTVIEQNDEKFVYIVDKNDIARKIIVETGLKNEKYVEIVSGLNIGDTVVVTGQDFISDGNTVNIVNNKKGE